MLALVIILDLFILLGLMSFGWSFLEALGTILVIEVALYLLYAVATKALD